MARDPAFFSGEERKESGVDRKKIEKEPKEFFRSQKNLHIGRRWEEREREREGDRKGREKTPATMPCQLTQPPKRLHTGSVARFTMRPQLKIPNAVEGSIRRVGDNGERGGNWIGRT
ncbi:hypothetical protein NPIL_144711 [Nephila pilipes]|uniref:Uncharacterized protein n=1 Tax=Nephila pilipes TaxID=299642 RepID=A0A8X6PPZ3_NEPPI|nr:hypothetical protein NPIL_144711 [Nephila pilipes]